MSKETPKRILGWAAIALLAAGLSFVAAGCGGGGKKAAKKSNLPTSIGKGEGALNLIEWPAYSDPSFASKFVKQTGCTIHRKDAGTSNDMVALMRTGGGGGGGQYDLVSASGDASLRLIRGGDVQPINVKLIPSWNDFIQIFKSPAHNTINGVHYGVSVQWGPNTLLYNTQKVAPAPTSWAAIYDSKYRGKVTVPDNPIQIADAALYLMSSKPSLGITDPYELNKTQFDAAVSLLTKQRQLIKKYWTTEPDEIGLFKSGDVVVGATWPYQTLQLQATKAPVKELIPKEGATGWADTWMLAKKAKHPHCAYLWMKFATTPQVEAKQALLFGETPVNPKACPFMNTIQAGSCSKYHLDQPLSYYKQIHFWKTPVTSCGNGKNDCMDYNAWQQAWTHIKG
jgi:putative spermidine/putrescine transport system substrate-binding protein